MKSLAFHRYVLEPAYAGSFRRAAALLRVEFEDGAIGYADLHPWASFGDLDLSDELAALQAGRPTRLGERSLYWAKRDAVARAAKRSLFEGLAVPDSHRLVLSLDAAPSPSDGFRRIKVKFGVNWASSLPALRAYLADAPEVLVRLDFNEQLSAASLRAFLEESRDLHARIDYLEDPTRDAAEWRVAKDFGLAVAADQSAETSEADVLVVKPAIRDLEELARRRASFRGRWVVTSYLDHPLGQAAAAVAAGELARACPGRVDVCGLLSQTVYAPNAFSEGLSAGPHFSAPPGTGFGWDEQLAGLDWRPV